MENMIELFRAVSQNGRWGLAVVGPEGAKLPAEGSVKHIGRIGGVETYVFTPGKTGTWVMVDEDVAVHHGATIVDAQDLQGGKHASLLLLGPYAVIEHFGYMRRGSWVCAYVNGVKAKVPQTVLAAMGLAKTKGEVKTIEPPPPLEKSMEDAFKRIFGEAS